MLYSDNLKFLCERNGNSYTQLAKILNISKSRFSLYINEKEIIPLTYLNTLCDYFDVSLDFIFNFTKTNSYKNSQKEINKLEVGKRLKEFRKENKLTQEKLASILNTVHPVISNYENGKFLIATPFLYTICKKYNISADYLLGKIDNPKYLNS